MYLIQTIYQFQDASRDNKDLRNTVTSVPIIQALELLTTLTVTTKVPTTHKHLPFFSYFLSLHSINTTNFANRYNVSTQINTDLYTQVVRQFVNVRPK